ncbi:MAG: response regulator [Gammaproteobacteria bacterium]
MSAAPIRVLLVDDHAVVRSGYRLYLEETREITVVAEAATADEAYRAYREHGPDVVVMDVAMPGSGGIEALRRIVAANPQARVLMFTMHDNPTFASQALRSGAIGFVTKDSPPDFLVRAVISAARGRRVLSPKVAEDMAFSVAQPEQNRFAELSPREFEICRLRASGYGFADIAAHLKLSPKTIANHLSLARAKLDVDSDIELFRLAVQAGIVPFDPVAAQSDQDH